MGDGGVDGVGCVALAAGAFVDVGVADARGVSDSVGRRTGVPTLHEVGPHGDEDDAVPMTDYVEVAPRFGEVGGEFFGTGHRRTFLS